MLLNSEMNNKFLSSQVQFYIEKFAEQNNGVQKLIEPEHK